MKKFLFLMTAALCLGLVLSSVAPVASGVAAAADGKEIYLAQKCNMCHAVSTAEIQATTKSEKMKGPDLAGLGKDADWLTKYIKKETDLNGKKHTKGYTGSEGDLKALVDWLAAQKK